VLLSAGMPNDSKLLSCLARVTVSDIEQTRRRLKDLSRLGIYFKT
jgi:hypothetical protein